MDLTEQLRLFECPICFRDFSEVDPITFPCGHSCCLNDAKKLKVCHMCGSKIPGPGSLFVNIMMRDIAKQICSVKSTSNANSSPQEEIVDSIKLTESFSLSTISEETSSVGGVDSRNKKKKKSKSKSSKTVDPSSAIDEASVITDATTEPALSVCSSAPEVDESLLSVNPIKLPDYRISNSGKSAMNLEEHFHGVKVLSLLVAQYLKNPSVCPRLVFGSSTINEGLLLVLTGVKFSPAHLISESVRTNRSLSEAVREVFPLLVISYAHCYFGETTCRKDELFMQEVMQDSQGNKCDSIRYKCTLVELHYYKNLLKSNRTKLSEEYVSRFRAQQSEECPLRPSFLVPFEDTSNSLVMQAPKNRPCSMTGCTVAGTMVCSKCKTAFYCCRDHQICHWKAGHKKECGNSAAADTAFTADWQHNIASIVTSFPGKLWGSAVGGAANEKGAADST